MRIKLILRLTVVVLTCLLLWAAVLWLLPASHTVRANPGALFVTVAGSGTACSQAQPCGLQTALAQSVAGDVVYVAAGTYTGSGAAVVTITKGVTLYGGWNGAASGTVLRDPVAYRSILDGEGARRVVYIYGAFACTVDGFTIQRGNASTGPYSGDGGGVYSYLASPVIANNIITGNTALSSSTGAWGHGGGIYVTGPAHGAVIRGNQVVGNIACGSASSMGGGLCLEASQGVQIVDNIVLNNTGSITNGNGYGGGIAISTSRNCTVTGNTIESNRATSGSVTRGGMGGGVAVESSAGVVLRNNRIRNNVAGVDGPGYGGGVSAGWENDLLVTENLVEGNSAAASPGKQGQGGGIYLYSEGNVNLDGNQVLGNSANVTAGTGGGLWIRGPTSLTMTNNIVAGNRASDQGGGMGLEAYQSAPVTGTLLHNTFVGNNAGSGYGQVGIDLVSGWIKLALVNNLLSTHSNALCVALGSTVTLTSTLFYGNSGGDFCLGGPVVNTGAITGQDPLLDATYHLRAGSPAIDAGVNADVTVDIDGDLRPIGTGYDIGADEYTERRLVYLPVVLKKQ
jgi:parallel beta-helix repeat protein